MTPSSARRGPGAAGLNAVAERLSERDLAVLREIGRHRFLSTEQVRRLAFTGHRTTATAARSARRVLARLTAERLVMSLPRRVGGLQGGATPAVWLLSGSGQRLLGLIDGRGAVSRVQETGQLFLRHYLAIAETHLALRDGAQAGHFELSDIQLEPGCWRPFIDHAGSRQLLKPDLFAVTASGDYEDHWFIEVDRGTEAIPTLIRQCQAYARYRDSGVEQAAHDVFPRVVWLLPTERRRDRLASAIASARGLSNSVFHAVTSGDLLPLVAGGAA